MREKKFKFHQRCKALSLTHFCFADDLMVFVEGSKESIEGALTVFNEFLVLVCIKYKFGEVNCVYG